MIPPLPAPVPRLLPPVPPDPEPVPIPPPERDFVAASIQDPRFGAKNHYILSRCWGYELPPAPPGPAWTPPPPNVSQSAPPPPDPVLAAKSRTFEEMELAARAAGSTTLQVPGMQKAIPVFGARPEEIEHLRHALDAIPPNARGFLDDVRAISIADCEVFKASDGSLSTCTSGVADDGRLVLNRTQLNCHQNHLEAGASPQEARRLDGENWFNCICHELAHVCDHHLAHPTPPSQAPESPMGHGVWYTNYAWQTQQPPEDLAEGFALLARQRWSAIHRGETPEPGA